jgi:hypothetical protein
VLVLGCLFGGFGDFALLLLVLLPEVIVFWLLLVGFGFELDPIEFELLFLIIIECADQ